MSVSQSVNNAVHWTTRDEKRTERETRVRHVQVKTWRANKVTVQIFLLVRCSVSSSASAAFQSAPSSDSEQKHSFPCSLSCKKIYRQESDTQRDGQWSLVTGLAWSRCSRVVCQSVIQILLENVSIPGFLLHKAQQHLFWINWKE